MDELKAKINKLKSALDYAQGEFEYEGDTDTLANFVKTLCDLLIEVLEAKEDGQ